MTVRKRSLGLLMAVPAIVGVGLWLERAPFEAALTKPKLSSEGSRATVVQPQRASLGSAEAKVRLQKMGRMPLYFIENRGQLDSRVAYYVQGRDTTLYFTADGMTLVQTEQRHEKNDSKDILEKASLGRGIPQTPDPVSRWVVKLDFVGANPNPKIEAGDRTPAVISYFKGRQEEWKAGLSTYGSIVYSDLWPGIDLVYSGTANRLKYTFLVKPGADPAQVRLAYRGVKGIRLNEAGQLEVETPAGVLQDDRPYAYQEVERRRVKISAGYSIDRASADGPNRYGFALGSYDRSKPLVLDPAVFVYAGYIGGSGDDYGFGIAVDSFGNAYVTGQTSLFGTAFPVTVGPDLTYNGGTYDAFVAKVNAAGTALVYCGYIGGSGNDRGSAIAVDSSGNAYVTGSTTSTEATFSVTVGPDLTFNGGISVGFGTDAFVAKVNAGGTALVYCGYIGGSGDDFVSDIAVDSSGNAYVTGQTSFFGTAFPVTVGPDLTFNGFTDAFVAKVNAAGTALVYCGYIGGSGQDYGYDIAVDSSGNAYVSGLTTSREATFPVTVGPDLSFNGGFDDAFVAKVNAAGTVLVYCGYIGGDGGEIGLGIAVDSSGSAYLTGSTDSTEATFPVTAGPDLTHNGVSDAFVAKVNAAGTALDYAGYIGGSGDEQGVGIAVDSSGNAYVTGYSGSSQATFPVTVGLDLTYNGGTYDAFVAKVNDTGTALLYCGYVGGSGDDYGSGIAVDSSGNAYVTGSTGSTEATFPVTVGPDLTYNGGTYDAFVAKIAEVAPSSGLVTLPAAASLHGAPPTFFHSDVSVFNPSATQPATVTARYRCFTGACGNAVQTFTVPPRQLRVFDDIVGTLFGAAETGGAVEFSGNVLVDSRLYTPSRPAPTVGMYVPGLSAAEAYAEAVVTSLSFSANLSTGFRTNVGVYNGNDVAQTVTFTLYNPQGVQIGQTSQLVPARTPLQINNIAGFVGITTDVLSFYCVVRGDGVSKNYVYAAVLDNQSQDLIFVKGANNAAVPAGLVTLPAAASLHGAPPTFFHSDVSVFNPSATQPATVTARYRCFTGACGNAVQTFTVPPRQLRVFDDIVGTLFGAAETGGAVEFSGNVLVDSRLYTPSRPAPTVGMYVPGLSAAEAYAEAVVTSLSFSANLSTGFRTNVGVYNGNDVAQTVTFTLYDPQGVQIGQASQLVPARTPLQINNIAGFVRITTDVPSFYCVVRGDGTSKNYVYAAVLDNQSQDLIFVKGAQSQVP